MGASSAWKPLPTPPFSDFFCWALHPCRFPHPPFPDFFPFGCQVHLMHTSSVWIPTPPPAFLFSPLVDRYTWWMLHLCGSPPQPLLSWHFSVSVDRNTWCTLHLCGFPHPPFPDFSPFWLTDTPNGHFVHVDLPPPPPPPPPTAFLTVFSLGWQQHLMDDSSALIPLHPTFLTVFSLGWQEHLMDDSSMWILPPPPLPWRFPFGCFIRMDPHPSLPFLTFSPFGWQIHLMRASSAWIPSLPRPLHFPVFPFSWQVHQMHFHPRGFPPTFLTVFPFGWQVHLMRASSVWRPACSWSSFPSILPSRSCCRDFSTLSAAARILSAAEPAIAKHITLWGTSFETYCKRYRSKSFLPLSSLSVQLSDDVQKKNNPTLTVSFLAKLCLTVRIGSCKTAFPVVVLWCTTVFILTGVTHHGRLLLRIK